MGEIQNAIDYSVSFDQAKVIRPLMLRRRMLSKVGKVTAAPRVEGEGYHVVLK